MKKSTNTQALHQCEVGCDWGHCSRKVYREAGLDSLLALWLLGGAAACSVTGAPSCKNCVPEIIKWSPGLIPSSTSTSLPTLSPILTSFWRATAPLPVFSATNAKYCPLMRVTFRNGIVAPSRRPHVTCTRACCEIRSFVCELSTAALAKTVCVSGSTCGDTNVIVVFASSSPVSFNNFTGNPTFRERERSTGT